MTKEYKKIESLKQLNELVGQGYKLYHDEKDKSKWFVIRGGDKYYIPASIRKEAPDMFGGSPVIHASLLPYPAQDSPEPEQTPEQSPKTEAPFPNPAVPVDPTTTHAAPILPVAPVPVAKKEQPQPGTYIQPIEFVLHDTARRALESVWVLEGLHTTPKQSRHELPFAFVGLDAKGHPQSVDKFGDKSELLLSLADLAVYFLIDCYMKYQNADEKIISLNVEKTLLYNAYMQEKEKRREIEEAMMLKMILKI